MFVAFWATVAHAIDGDSVVVHRSNGRAERIRVGGVDVPSRGPSASAAKRAIDSWRGRSVHVKPTASRRVHGEIPAIVVDKHGVNLGVQLLAHGVRLERFAIRATPLLALRVPCVAAPGEARGLLRW